MSAPRIRDLAFRYLADALTPEEHGEFVRLLKEDPEARRILARESALASETQEWAREQLRNPSAAPPRVARPRFARRSTGGLLRWAAVAAAALLAAGLFLYFRTGGEPALARVEEASGSASIVGREGEERPARAGGEILGGERVRTARNGSVAIVSLSEATRMVVRGESDLAMRETPQGLRVRLSRGGVDATVASQARGRPLVFETPNAEARILGTRLSLSVSESSTRLEVQEGKVRLSKVGSPESVDVAADHYAVVAKETRLEAKRVGPPAAPQSPGEALVAGMAPNSWQSVPKSHLRQAVPDPARYPRIQGIMGPRGIMESWSGGALDTKRRRLIVWGGGATNYRGNEIYAFDLHALQWKRLTDPSPDPADGKDVNPDGRPNARDTFNGLAYVAHADRFFALGGALSGTAAKTGADIPWMFDFASEAWIDPKPAGPRPRTGEGDSCAYDPVARKIWFLASSTVTDWGLSSLDVEANRWTKHSDDHLASHTCAMDAERGLLVAVGRGDVSAFDVRGRATRQIWKTTGGDPIVAAHGPGFDFDPVRGRFVGWTGGAVTSLDPQTRVWIAQDAPGAPPRTPNGIFGRWRYVPGLDVFVVATTIDEDVHFYKPGK